MLFRFGMALLLGALLGVERELVKKEAGVRTEMLVAGGACLFTILGISLPYITAASIGTVPDASTVNAGLGVVANVVIGIGFLGAGLIVKLQDEHPHGVTTAALVWATAGIGVLAGVGLVQFASAAALLIAVLLILLRELNIPQRLEGLSRRPKRKSR